MNRLFAVAAAAAATLALAPVSGFAQTPGGYYSATPVTAPAKSSFVTRTTVWKCGDGACAASTKSTSRDAIMCELVVREVGALSSFSAGTTAFDAAALEKCNARAK